MTKRITSSRVLFCDAYHKGVYGNKYQWLIVGMYQKDWWKKGTHNCTAEQIQTALIGSMVMDILPLASNEEITISKRVSNYIPFVESLLTTYCIIFVLQTPGEYESEYLNMTKHFSRYHGYAYDGIWAAAMAIQEVGRHAKNHLNLSLADFDYRLDLL